MLSLAPEFTPLEQTVLGAICEMHAEDRQLLEAQLATATFRSRKNTFAGFYTDFDVNQKGIAAITGEKLRAGPQVKVTELNHGMGFILWFKDGYAHCLEGYTYDDSTAGIDLGKISFELT